jgi:carboxymethylenebutenolidase
MTAGSVTYPGADGEQIIAYVARPEGDGPFGGVVLIHNAPGFSEMYQEFARRFAHHGYNAIVPHIYREGGNGTPAEVVARLRELGGVADDHVVADCGAAMEWLKALPTSNGKVGIIGSCSAGRAAVLTASRVPGFAAVVDLWGGRVVPAPNQQTEKQPVAPSDYTADLNAPLLGLFGNDDQNPSPAAVDQHEALLKQHGKDYEFHRYDGAGHGFFHFDTDSYRWEQATDGWNKVFDFFGRHLK